MTLRSLLAALLMGAALWLAPSAAQAEESTGVEAREAQVFLGDYEWNVDGHSNQLEATFDPLKEDGLWSVTFDFKYARREGRYEGQAQGSLEAGSIHGEVKDGSGIVRYRFEAVVEEGRLEGKHFNIYGGRKEETGWMRLERVVEEAPADSDGGGEG